MILKWGGAGCATPLQTMVQNKTIICNQHISIFFNCLKCLQTIFELVPKNHVSIQHINLNELLEVTASIIKYTSILILNCLQELIDNLLHLQTMYPIATSKNYQNFITDIVKLKQKQFQGVNILIKQRSISFNK